MKWSVPAPYYNPNPNHSKATNLTKTIFPRFDDGDADIKLSRKEADIYILHSLVIPHSPFFKASLSERWASSGDTGCDYGREQDPVEV
jgi:hypothetical protein